MYDYSTCPNKLIFCVDLKSFFASVSCVILGLDPLKVKLAVVGDVTRDGSIVLAATPAFKKIGIGTGNRKWEIPNDNDIYVVNPSMNTYVQISNQITELILSKYAAPVDFFQYSIDEFFVDFTNYTYLHKKTPYELASSIQKDIFAITGVNSAIGIGPNMLMAKIALDHESKKDLSGIAHWTYDDIQTKLWNIKPLNKFWGISGKTQAKLNRLGISTIRGLANYPKEILIKHFGNVIGTELHLHSNGIDFSQLSEMKDYKPADKSIGKSQVLLRDYKADEIKTLILEQLEEVCYRLRNQRNLCRTIQFSLGYSSNMGGFSKSVTLEQPTDLTLDWFNACLKILNKHYNNEPVRTISISLKNFVKEDFEQLSFFSNPIRKQKEKNLAKTMDLIRSKYGKNSLLRACSYLEHSTIRENNNKIGGHYT
ncbi:MULTISPECIES: Y-family DNA polymerase [Bacillus]|uniref:Y-family DNA polymerase n=1 Tax=Bacillus TaxID=1386 RepID=UPI000303A10C|nr:MULTISPECIES: UV-damage repair protein uvrX [Bacillus]